MERTVWARQRGDPVSGKQKVGKRNGRGGGAMEKERNSAGRVKKKEEDEEEGCCGSSRS